MGRCEPITSPEVMTPIQRVGDIHLKRDDLFQINGACGGKLRQAIAILKDTDADGIVGYGGRQSNTGLAMGVAAGYLKRIAVFHTAAGQPTTEMRATEESGAKVLKHKPGYLGVLKARATKYAKETGWPLGLLATSAAIKCTKLQVANLVGLPIKRIVVPVGAGYTLMGILYGLHDFGIHVDVLGVTVGGGSAEVAIQQVARSLNPNIHVTYDRPKCRYETACDDTVGPVVLDPFYESKCVQFLQKGDLLWVAGNRKPPRMITLCHQADEPESSSGTPGGWPRKLLNARSNSQ